MGERGPQRCRIKSALIIVYLHAFGSKTFLFPIGNHSVPVASAIHAVFAYRVYLWDGLFRRLAFLRVLFAPVGLTGRKRRNNDDRGRFHCGAPVVSSRFFRHRRVKCPYGDEGSDEQTYRRPDKCIFHAPKISHLRAFCK